MIKNDINICEKSIRNKVGLFRLLVECSLVFGCSEMWIINKEIERTINAAKTAFWVPGWIPNGNMRII